MRPVFGVLRIYLKFMRFDFQCSERINHMVWVGGLRAFFIGFHLHKMTVGHHQHRPKPHRDHTEHGRLQEVANMRVDSAAFIHTLNRSRKAFMGNGCAGIANHKLGNRIAYRVAVVGEFVADDRFELVGRHGFHDGRGHNHFSAGNAGGIGNVAINNENRRYIFNMPFAAQINRGVDNMALGGFFRRGGLNGVCLELPRCRFREFAWHNMAL